MNRLILSVAILSLVFVACSKKSDDPSHANDTLLTKPMTVPPVVQPPPGPNDSGLYIDRSRLRTPEHEKLMARFEPQDVVDIYHDFKPLRKKETSQDEIDAYIKKKKITLDELKAVLEEGDRLGWNKAQ